MLKILVINGPNINMLGIREPDIYGRNNYESLVSLIGHEAESEGLSAECFQSNYEGEIVEKIQKAYGEFDGIIINPAAYTHTSIAILDALKAVALPAIEVHISDVDSRESFRQISYAGLACIETIKGLGFEGYVKALRDLKSYIQDGHIS